MLTHLSSGLPPFRNGESPIRDGHPAEAGRCTRDTRMSPRNHVHPRGRRHQWRGGLTAWPEESQSRTSLIRCLSFSVSSSILRPVEACCAIASSACWGLQGWVAAPHRLPRVGRAGGIVGADARALGAEHARPRGPDRGFAPATWGRELSRVYGRGRWWLGPGPACDASGAPPPRASWGSGGAWGRPCAEHGARAFAPVAGRGPGLSRHSGGGPARALPRKPKASPSAMSSYRGPRRRARGGWWEPVPQALGGGRRP
jgi:hypothetical protein